MAGEAVGTLATFGGHPSLFLVVTIEVSVEFDVMGVESVQFAFVLPMFLLLEHSVCLPFSSPDRFTRFSFNLQVVTYFSSLLLTILLRSR